MKPNKCQSKEDGICNLPIGTCTQCEQEIPITWEQAMETARKESAIAFLKWRESLGLVRQQRDGLWLINYGMNEFHVFAENDEELYNLFLEEQKTISHEQ